MLNGELLGGGVLTGQIGREVITISKEEQDVVIEPRREQFDVYPDVGKVIKKATVKAVTSDIDENIVARNIRGGVTILGVTGDLEPDKPDQSKVVEPSTSEQVVTADSGFELASVTIKPVTAEIDGNIQPANIKSGVTILGVAGTVEEAKEEETKSVELDMAGGDQVVVPSENKVLTQVTVKKPETFVAENIRKNVEIGGVKGTLEGADESLIKSINLAYAQQMDIMNEIYSGTHFIERDYTDSEMQKLEATLVSLTQGG